MRFGILGVGDLPLTREILAPIMGSTAYAVSSDAKSIALLGQDRRHHSVDPYLDDGLRLFGATQCDIATFRRRWRHFDLCLEDSWTGWFLAPTLKSLDASEAVVLVHFDDHADMMPTLLIHNSTGAVRDPEADLTFDPKSQANWETAIASGAITIGSWLTALVAPTSDGAPNVHIRHIRPAREGIETAPPKSLNVGTIRHTHLLAGCFLAIDGSEISHGSLQTGSQPNDCLENLPKGKILVHIDLDYFHNDFNGNTGTAAAELNRPSIIASMDVAFDALDAINRPVHQWIVATSPGFCCARHWSWLLRELEERIASRQSRPDFGSAGIQDASPSE